MFRKFFQRFRNIFDLTRAEQRGFFVLLGGLLLLVFVRVSINWLPTQTINIQIDKDPKINTFLIEQKRLDDSVQMERGNRNASYTSNYNYFSSFQLTPFDFNADTMKVADWEKMGFSEKQSTQIYNYLAKSGGLRKKEDLKKIYCINEENYTVLEPYIHLSSNVSASVSTNYRERTTAIATQKVELNTADSLDLLKIPGIGSKTAAKIIEYRAQLGGFYDVTQLREIYIIDSARFAQISPYLRADKQHIETININTASTKELSKHPYIDTYLAKSIYVHRQKTGNYTSVEQIKKAAMLYEDLYQKIAPYLSVE
ncbi:MAG: helix-hairpin-helix domain-containing protein [Bacteroidales bacterium]|jgi:DNA uptake protein ComE-like DNA-binding protein|nr:helix-hairpin-helix domain-containing protein [Bacteroidales bacterium]